MKCFELWYVRCPELKHDGERIRTDDAEELATHGR